MRALEELGPEVARIHITTLANHLLDVDWSVRAAVVHALGALGSDIDAAHIESLLLRLRTDAHPQVRCAVVAALASWGARATPYSDDLAACAADDHEQVRTEAREALQKVLGLQPLDGPEVDDEDTSDDNIEELLPE